MTKPVKSRTISIATRLLCLGVRSVGVLQTFQLIVELLYLRLQLLLLVQGAVDLGGVHVPKRLLVPWIVVFYPFHQVLIHVVQRVLLADLVRVGGRIVLAELEVQIRRTGRHVLRQDARVLAI